MSIKVITDSASNLSQDELKRFNVDIVSLTYKMDDVVHNCYDETKTYEEQGKIFYNALREGKEIKTSLASPSVYYDKFKEYLTQGYDILYISISSKLSGTLNSARNAASMLEDEFPGCKIICLDSLSASFGEGICALYAAQLAQNNESLENIISKVENIRLNIRNEFTVDNLTYLKVGGRIQSFIFSIVNLLDIKPLLSASKEATIALVDKVRGRKKSLLKLVETVKNTILLPEKQTLFIAHCDVIDDAKKVAAMIKEAVPTLKDIVISMYDFCTGAHVGPGTIALFYYGKEREQ